MKKKIDWKEQLEDYLDFLDCGEDRPNPKTQKEAKEFLKQEIENVICMNGVHDLYEYELKLIKELGMKI